MLITLKEALHILLYVLGAGFCVFLGICLIGVFSEWRHNKERGETDGRSRPF